MPSIFDDQFNQAITIKEAYGAMVTFLQEYRRRGGDPRFEALSWAIGLNFDGSSTDQSAVPEFARAVGMARETVRQAEENWRQLNGGL